MKRKPTIGIISLGCAKNLVDSEQILGRLQESGYDVSADLEGADVAVINTCAFIRDATEESIDAILEAVGLKQRGELKGVIVAGCLPQRYWQDNLAGDMEEVDAFVGVGRYGHIGEIVDRVIRGEPVHAVNSHPGSLPGEGSPRFSLTPDHYAYVKISEGCDNRCAYCVIPRLRGPYRSRSMESILKEVEQLTRERSLSEINLVGQDTTFYGTDLYGAPKLAELLRRLAGSAPTKWIRLLYTHPAHLKDDVIDILGREPCLCRYVDIPLQHINDDILLRMGRGVNREHIEDRIGILRDRIPGVTLRTTFIVGFPGETEEQFEELLRFVESVRFERLGAFSYSQEEGTLAADLPDQITEDVKEDRLRRLMTLQRDLSLERNKTLIHTEAVVLIDGICEEEENLYLARTEGDAPDVDQLVYVQAEECHPGQFIRVRITDAYEYDLIAEPVRTS